MIAALIIAAVAAFYVGLVVGGRLARFRPVTVPPSAATGVVRRLAAIHEELGA